MRYRVLNTEGPEHYAIWKHLPDIIRDGRQNGFVREFGAPGFEYAKGNERYRRTFDRAMTGYSIAQSNLVLEALRDYDFSSLRTMARRQSLHRRTCRARAKRAAFFKTV